jgi:hypothetical protein
MKARARHNRLCRNISRNDMFAKIVTFSGPSFADADRNFGFDIESCSRKGAQFVEKDDVFPQKAD